MVAVFGLLVFGGKDDGLSCRKSRIGAGIPAPNDGVTMPIGAKMLTEAVFRDTGLDDLLNSLKRDQVAAVSRETVALVANSPEMTGISVNRIDSILDDEDVCAEYGLGAASPKSLCRTVERLGRNVDLIVSHLGRQLTSRYGVTLGKVLMDWTSMYFEAPAKGTVVRFGHSRDHRPDRPQVVVGLSVDQESGMPAGLTVVPGNVLDVTHFEETFRQLLPLLPEDAMIVFDNGAYSRTNAKTIDDAGMGFLTHLQLNASDDAFVKAHQDEWEHVCDNMYVLRTKGNLGRTRFIFLSEKRHSEVLKGYRRKAERDYDDMDNLRNALDKGKKPRKKYRVSNVFVDTHLSYRFPLAFTSREEAVDHAVRTMTSGREGIFVLLTNRPLTSLETLTIYRSRNAVETAFRDLKHGIDWRPARCMCPDAIRGRVLISFLALFCMSMAIFLYPELRAMAAETMVSELTSFSLTVHRRRNGLNVRIFSNFGRVIRVLYGVKPPAGVPKAPGQAVLDAFLRSEKAN